MAMSRNRERWKASARAFWTACEDRRAASSDSRPRAEHTGATMRMRRAARARVGVRFGKTQTKTARKAASMYDFSSRVQNGNDFSPSGRVLPRQAGAETCPYGERVRASWDCAHSDISGELLELEAAEIGAEVVAEGGVLEGDVDSRFQETELVAGVVRFAVVNLGV